MGFSPWLRPCVNGAMVTDYGSVAPIVREPIPASCWSDPLEKHKQQTELPSRVAEKRG